MQLMLRSATMDDWQLLLKWRNDPETRKASRDTTIVDESAHRSWLQNCLQADNRQLLIAEVDTVPVGTVRLDLDEVCDVSWTVAPEARGRGFGKQMVSAAVRTVKLPMKAVARVENIGSQKIAEAAGFQIVEDDGVWRTFQRKPGTMN
jgi:RimJ/RimL family protein N-acetyltransferase